MFAPFRRAWRAFWRDETALEQRLVALESAQQDLALELRERFDDRLADLDKLYHRVHSALGRIYRLKGWEQEGKEPQDPTRPSQETIMAAKFRR